MEKKFQFFRKLLLLTLLMLGVGSAFGMDSWVAHKSVSEPKTEGSGNNLCHLIYTPQELAWFADFVNKQKQNAQSCAKLMADLDMTGNFWIPISVGGTQHKVNFDGNGYIIRNLYLSASEILALPSGTWTGYNNPNENKAQNLGLIGASTGHVQNVILENVQVYAYGKNYNSYSSSGSSSNNIIKGPLSIGTVVGWQSAGSVIEGCYVTGEIITEGDGQAVGGIVGNNGGGIIRNCYSAVNIHANGLAYVGGIAGYTKNYTGDVTIESCVYAGETLASEGTAIVKIDGVEKEFHSQVGAIVGNHYNGNTTFTNVYYDNTKFDNAVGEDMTETYGGQTNGETEGVDLLNSEIIACALNHGEIVDEVCSEDSPWSLEENGLSLNDYGSDCCTIVFDANGGSFDEGLTVEMHIPAGDIVNGNGITTPHRDADEVYVGGYIFAGWSVNQNAVVQDKSITASPANKRVYAVWIPIYTIKFNANSGTFSNNVSEKELFIERGAKIGISNDFTKPQRDGFYFKGWNTDKFAEDALVDENGFDDLPNADANNMVLYAIWTEKTTHMVTFYANGHGTTVSGYVEFSVEDNKTIESLMGENFDFGLVEGYTLDKEHWCVDAGCSELFDLTTPITSDVSLYAKWTMNTYTITFDSKCGGKCSSSPKTIEFSVENRNFKNDQAYSDPTWDVGHRFVGWSLSSEENNIVSEIPKGVANNITLYAVWDIDLYTITYNAGANGKGVLIPVVKTEYGETHEILGTSFTRNGYTQDGWSLSDGSEKIDYTFNQSVSNVSINLYPHWVENRQIVLQSGAVTVYEYATDGRKEAVIDGEYTGADAVNIPTPIEVDNIIINRKFGAGVPSTIVLPFTLPEGTNLNGAKFYYLKSVAQEEGKNTWKATMKWIGSNKLPEANKPYGVICPSPTLELSLNGNKATFKTTQQEGKDTVYYEVSEGDWRFVGVYAKKQWQPGDEELEEGLAYALAGTAGKGLRAGDFGKVTSENWTYPLRSYMRKKDNTVQLQSLPQAVRARGASYGLNNIGSEIIEVEFVDDEKTTAIGRMNTVTGEIKIDRWFDLKGRSVKNVNRAAKGAYYGKKVFHE